MGRVVEPVTDPGTREQTLRCDALLRRYLGSPDNPESTLWRVRSTRVRFMREWALEYHEVPLTPYRIVQASAHAAELC